MLSTRARAFLRTFRKEAAADRIGDVAAMMTYYAVFALFPMMIFVVTIALMVVPQSTIDEGLAMAARAMPTDVAQILADQSKRMAEAAGAGFALGSLVLALWGASRGASALMSALNDLFDKKETRSFLKRQAVAIGTTLLVSALLVVAMGLITAGPAVGHAIADYFGLGAAFDVFWGIARWAAAAVLVMLVWAILYKLLPDTDAPFRIFTPGAAIGVALWFGVTQLFALYLDNFASYEKTYGTVAVVIVFLTWMWLSNVALLVGAEVNDVLAEMRKDESPAAAKLAEKEQPTSAEKDKAGPTAAMRPTSSPT